MDTESDTSGSIPGATTTVDNTLVVMAVAANLPDVNGVDTNFSGWTNSDLANLTEVVDYTRNAGNGGSLGVAIGERAIAGTYGDTSVTLANSATKAMMTIALKPSLTPRFIGAGQVAAGNANITPQLPPGIQANDLLLLFVETADEPATISPQTTGTWTEVSNSPQSTGGALASATRLTVFWSRYDGSQGNPTIIDPGNHAVGVVLAFRDVISTGNPWDVTSGGVDTESDTSGSIPGATTTVPNTLVVMAIATHVGGNSQNFFSDDWTNSDLVDVNEVFDIARNAGNGGSLGVAIGVKPTAGTYGDTSVTPNSSATKAMMTIALKPLNEAPTLSISQPDGTSDTITRGDPYNITYTLSDPDDVVTAAFYYDTDNSGLDGTPIPGACATAPEGTNVMCQLDTTGMAPGSYYIYGIASDGANPAVSAYSSGQLTINPVVNSRDIAEHAGIADGITTAQILSRFVMDQSGIADGITTAQILSRFVIDEFATMDGVVGGLSFSQSLAEQAAMSDTIEAVTISTFGVSIIEQAGLQDRIHRGLNGYSAGTVYRSDTGEYGLNSVKYRQWDPTALIWSPEVELPDTGSPIRDVRIAFSPVSEMRVVVSHSEDGTLNLFR
ncbi:MAG: hypothetical protein HRF40_11950, partial [Nitrososphaera sp.]